MMIVKVQQKHIDEGVPGEPGLCPIACALEEMGHQVRVCSEEVKFQIDRNIEHTIGLPKEARDFIDAFDAERICMPFVFELGEPDED